MTAPALDMSGGAPARLRISVSTTIDPSLWPGVGELDRWDGFVFQSREFLETWIETIGRGRGSEGYFVVVEDGSDTPAMLLPLCIERRLGTRILRFLDGGVADYNAPLLRRGWTLADGEATALWQDILALLPTVDLIQLRKLSALCGTAPNPLAGALSTVTATGVGSSIAISGSWEEFSGATGRRRYVGESRRNLRTLQGKGDVAFQVVTDAAEAERVRAFLFRHKRAQYLRTTGTDLFGQPGYAEFFGRIGSPPLLGGLGHLSYLSCGGEMVAAHLGYSSGERYYLIMPAYDAERFEKASGGRLLLEFLMREEFARKCRVFDFGEGAEPYKRIWATDTLSLLDFTSPQTLRGRLAVGLHRLRSQRSEAARPGPAAAAAN